MIKILHTSDWHLGKIIYGMSLLDEQKNFMFNTLISIINQENPDVIIIAGDVFDRQIASIDAIKLFDKFISLIQEKYSISIVIITGNHDSKDRIAIARHLLKPQNIYISTEIVDVFDFIDIKKDGKTVRLHPLAYFDLASAKSFLSEDEISYANAYKKIIAQIEKNTKGANKNILISHCFVAGTDSNQVYDESYVGNSAAVGCENFKNFDYVALGHIHKVQNIKGNIHYSGSPIKTSFDEPPKAKSLTVIEIDNEIILRQIPIEPMHNMRTVEGKFKDIVEMGKQNPSDDYILINLEDDTPVYMPIEQLRIYYKNILSLQYINNWELKDSFNSNSNNLICDKNADEKYILEQFFKNICDVNFDNDFYEIFKNARFLIKEEEK